MKKNILFTLFAVVVFAQASMAQEITVFQGMWGPDSTKIKKN